MFGFSRGVVPVVLFLFFFNDTATTEIYTLSLHDALPISLDALRAAAGCPASVERMLGLLSHEQRALLDILLLYRSEEHTSELQSQSNLVCRLLLEKKKKHTLQAHNTTTNHAPHSSTNAHL